MEGAERAGLGIILTAAAISLRGFLPLHFSIQFYET